MPKAPTLAQLLDEWFPLTTQLADLTTRERELRQQIFDLAFPSPERGTNKTKLDHGMALIGIYKMNYNIDRAGLEAATSAAGDNERAIIEAVISYSPKVKEAAFEELSDDDKKIVGPFITVKPGLPSLEVKPQSKVRW